MEVKDETIIRKIPQFFARTCVNITVPGGYMGRYYKLKVEPRYEAIKRAFLPTQKKIVACKIYSELDKNELVLDWIAAGCVESWNIVEIKQLKNYLITTIDSDGSKYKRSFVATNLGQAYEKFVVHMQSLNSYYNIHSILASIHDVEIEALTDAQTKFY